jgi:DMSO/TMAO reductase YedYZ heme-binding membrane subunit
VWKKLHYASYAAFGMVSVHGLFAGTEGTNLGLQLLIGVGILLVVLLLGIRMGKNQVKPVAKSRGTHSLSQSD